VSSLFSLEPFFHAKERILMPTRGEKSPFSPIETTDSASTRVSFECTKSISTGIRANLTKETLASTAKRYPQRATFFIYRALSPTKSTHKKERQKKRGLVKIYALNVPTRTRRRISFCLNVSLVCVKNSKLQ